MESRTTQAGAPEDVHDENHLKLESMHESLAGPDGLEFVETLWQLRRRCIKEFYTMRNVCDPIRGQGIYLGARLAPKSFRIPRGPILSASRWQTGLKVAGDSQSFI